MPQILRKFGLVRNQYTIEGYENFPVGKMKDLMLHSMALARTQFGCRFLQG